MDGRFVAVSATARDQLGALARLGRPPVDGLAGGREALGTAAGMSDGLLTDDLSGAHEGLARLVGAVAADDAVRLLRQAGLAASVVNSVADLVREPHLWSRGDLVRRPDGEGGEIVMQGIVPVLSRTPGRLGDWSRRPGSDNEIVLGTLLDYSPERAREVTSAPAATPAPAR